MDDTLKISPSRDLSPRGILIFISNCSQGRKIRSAVYTPIDPKYFSVDIDAT